MIDQRAVESHVKQQKAVAGSLTRISAGMAGVWGLNAANQVL